MDAANLITRASTVAKGREEKEYIALMRTRLQENGKLSEHQKMILQRVIDKHQPQEQEMAR